MSSLTRATAIMTAGTVLSRVTGLLRVTAIAAALGIVESGGLTDAYNAANTAPNIIYELVLGGVLTSVFVPVFVELLDKEGRERAWQVASAITNVALVVLTAIATIGVLGAPLIARFYAARTGEQAAEQAEILTFLLRLFIPQIIFYGLYAITSGLLNANKRFGPPMFTPVLNNLAVIAVFVSFHQAYGTVSSLQEVTRAQLLWIGLGTTAGVVLQAAAQLPWLRGLGSYRLVLSLAHPSIRRLARLSVFVIGYVATNQVGYLIVQWLAYGQTGGYSAYVAAFIFFMLPHGLFAVSVMTALLPGMSEHAVHERWQEFRDRLSVGWRVTLLVLLPAAVGYFVLAEPIIRLLLEHGVMQARSVHLVAGVLRFFVLGLVPFSLFQLTLRAFYAMQDTKTPFLVNCAAVIFHSLINVPLFVTLQVRGLAAGHALSYLLAVVLLARALSRRVGGLDLRAHAAGVARSGAAAAGMGIVVWAALWLVTRWAGTATFTAQLIAVVVPVATGIATYYALARALGVGELRMVSRLVVRRKVP